LCIDRLYFFFNTRWVTVSFSILRTPSYESIIGNVFASFCHQESSTVTCPHCEVSVDCFLNTRCCYSSLHFKSILSPQNADALVLFLVLRIVMHGRQVLSLQGTQTKILAPLLRLMESTFVVHLICVCDRGFILGVVLYRLAQFAGIVDNRKQSKRGQRSWWLHFEQYIPKNRSVLQGIVVISDGELKKLCPVAG